MHSRYRLKATARLQRAAEDEDEFALRVVLAYQDGLTRCWAMELWERVGHLIGSGGVARLACRMSDLVHPVVFAQATEAAAKAHIVVVSFRDAGGLPPRLGEWFEAWCTRRHGTGGALVCLIGVQVQANGLSGQAYGYLAGMARRAGMDFLPHERKLPEESSALANTVRVRPATGRPMSLRAA